jgi:hypothetical protein
VTKKWRKFIRENIQLLELTSFFSDKKGYDRMPRKAQKANLNFFFLGGGSFFVFLVQNPDPVPPRSNGIPVRGSETPVE